MGFEQPHPVKAVPKAGWNQVIFKGPFDPNHSMILKQHIHRGKSTANSGWRSSIPMLPDFFEQNLA